MKAPIKDWIKFSVATIAYILFLAWVGNFWWILLLPLIFDAYITHKIPWTWWKKSKNKAIRQVMPWVDAILFALVAVYFINNFFFQNYQIPTSSLERSLLVGDYLLVSKCTYGPRIPNTPLSFPLAQHTLPGTESTNSYIEWPQWDYKRMTGMKKIKRNDIVVFNFPAGDTVALRQQNPDYYTLCYLLGKEPGTPTDSTINLTHFEQRMERGRQAIKSRINEFGEIRFRPIDRRENYVKRCIGLPGDTLAVRNAQVYINSAPLANPRYMQLVYYVHTQGAPFDEAFFHREQVNIHEVSIERGNGETIYSFPMTEELRTKVSKLDFVKSITQLPDNTYIPTVYPLAYSGHWTNDNYGPIWIPRAGSQIELTPDNVIRYERVIRDYERRTISSRSDGVYIDGEKTSHYTFRLDYYFMMGDNRHNSADSRAWGFVPEDHIVGTPLFVWLSINADAPNLFDKIRWSRLFRSVEALSR